MKLEGFNQCSGESVYANDYPHTEQDVWCTWVVATEVNATISKIDPSQALVSIKVQPIYNPNWTQNCIILHSIITSPPTPSNPLSIIISQKLPGVYGFYMKADIPGENLVLSPEVLMYAEKEALFVEDRVLYHGQPCGVIAAKNFNLAQRAAKLVRITYERPQQSYVKVLPDVRAVVESLGQNRIQRGVVGLDNSNGVEKQLEKEEKNKFQGKHEIKGEFNVAGQYHYTMEPQTTVCIPRDGKYDVYCATQWIGNIHWAISKVLKVPGNKINITVSRLGGGYGSKISGAVRVAATCALVSYHLQRPARFVLQLEQNMGSIGKRWPMMANYHTGFDDQGMIEGMTLEFFCDAGCSQNDFVAPLVQGAVANCYHSDHWTIKPNSVLTDAPSNLWARGPGDVEGIAYTENIMEHIAFVLKKDAMEVRMANMDPQQPLYNIYKEFVQTVDYGGRKQQVEEFNVNNRWKKRGIATMPMKYHFFYFGTFSIFLSIYHDDMGSVSITHGGIEMGQGLNTKVCQVVAHFLRAPLEAVHVKPSTEQVSPNSFPTGGSQTSEAIAYVSG